MEALFLKILNMSLSAAAVICVVALVRLALRRAPKKWSYLLWAVAAFRLVCPVSLSAPFSILRLAAQPAAVTESASGASSAVTYIPQDIGFMASPRVYVGPPAVSNAVSSSLPAAAPMNSANPLQIWITVGTALWCLGMAALLLYGMISYVNLRLRLRGAVRMENGVFETDAVRSPFILGLLHPVIYLPAGLEGEPLRYVLAHERFHIRRGDHAVKLLAFALLCVHWFNPLVWLAFFLMSRDMEMRCDEAVLSAEQGITKPYSMALLSFATARRFPSPSPLAFGETGVKQRIKNALRWRKPKVWVTVLCALVCTAAVAACAVNPAGNEKTNAPTGTPWDWTSTVQLSDVKGFAEGRGITLSHTQMQQLIGLLNAVRPEEIVRGRGIPSDKTLDITTGVGYRLRWGGGVIELDFNDAAAAAKLYGSETEPGPGVWEIHNEALYAFLDGLEAAPTQASASDLAAFSQAVFNTDGITGITFFSANPDESPAMVPAAYMDEIKAWLDLFRRGEPVDAARGAAPGADSISVQIEYSDGTIMKNSLGTINIDGTQYYLLSPQKPACWYALWTLPTSAESLRTLQQEDPARFTSLMQAWNAEVDMFGEQFVSEAGEAGSWQDLPSAFASRWCEKYLNASVDSPYHCSDAIVWLLGDYMNAASLTGAPRRLAFNVTLALGLPAEREELFTYARMGWARKDENGLMEISTEAVLESDDGVHWAVVGMNSGGSAGWGWRELRDTEYAKGVLHTALEQREMDALLRYLPNMDWGKLTDEEQRTAMELVLSAAVSDEPSYANGQDQLIRDLYMLWGTKRADGAFAELYLDGPDCVLARQMRADPEAFAAALVEMDAPTQALVRHSMQDW